MTFFQSILQAVITYFTSRKLSYFTFRVLLNIQVNSRALHLKLAISCPIHTSSCLLNLEEWFNLKQLFQAGGPCNLAESGFV